MAKVATETPVKLGLRKSERSNSGRVWKSSTRTKAMNAAAEPANIATIVPLVQPRALPRMRPNSSRNIAAAKVTRPRPSRRVAPGSVWLRIFVEEIQIVTTPTGTLTMKIQRQPMPLVSAPPTIGPTAAAPPTVAPHDAIALPRAGPWKSWAMRARPVANIAAPPTPWRARDQMSMLIDWASPQSSDAMVNTANPAMKTRFRPKRSASDPQVRMSVARVGA